MAEGRWIDSLWGILELGLPSSEMLPLPRWAFMLAGWKGRKIKKMAWFRLQGSVDASDESIRLLDSVTQIVWLLECGPAVIAAGLALFFRQVFLVRESSPNP